MKSGCIVADTALSRRVAIRGPAGLRAAVFFLRPAVIEEVLIEVLRSAGSLARAAAHPAGQVLGPWLGLRLIGFPPFIAQAGSVLAGACSTAAVAWQGL